MQSNIKTYGVIYGLLGIAILTLAGMVGTIVFMISLLKAEEIVTCEVEKKQLTTVANITNATGQLPDGTRLKVGETVSVKPDYCK